MKTHDLIFSLFLIFGILFWSCERDKYQINSYQSKAGIQGTWFSKQYTPGYEDTVLTRYKFLPDSQFVISRVQFLNVGYQDTLIQEGTFSVPSQNLMIFKIRHTRQGENESFAQQTDTVVYQVDWALNLTIWGKPRLYQRLGGNTPDLKNGTFYGWTPYRDRYIHNKYIFREDSAYFYSLVTSDSQQPAEWQNPMKFKIKIFGPVLTLYEPDGTTTTRGFVLYKQWLLLTQTASKYRYVYY